MLSARLDGEPVGPGEAAAADRHLEGCAACARFADAAHAVTRRARLEAAGTVPDLVPAVLAALAAETGPPARPAARSGAARREEPSPFKVGLVALALVQVVTAVGALVSPGAAALGHAHRDLGAFDLALGVGLAYAAWRPRRAEALLPMLAALAGFLVVAAVLDVAGGAVDAWGEAPHLLAPLGLGLVWAERRRPELGAGRAERALAP